MPATTEVDTRPLLHKREIAALRMGISLRTLDELISSKQIKVVKIGSIGSKKKRCLVSEEAIQDFIRRGEKESRRGR